MKIPLRELTRLSSHGTPNERNAPFFLSGGWRAHTDRSKDGFYLLVAVRCWPGPGNVDVNLLAG